MGLGSRSSSGQGAHRRSRVAVRWNVGACGWGRRCDGCGGCGCGRRMMGELRHFIQDWRAGIGGDSTPDNSVRRGVFVGGSGTGTHRSRRQSGKSIQRGLREKRRTAWGSFRSRTEAMPTLEEACKSKQKNKKTSAQYPIQM